MLSSLLLTVLLYAPAADPTSVVIFGRDRWFQSVRGDEEVFIGVLERLPGRNQRNSFCLVMKEGGKTTTREIFVGEEGRQLLPFVNRVVKITGMAVDLKVDQRMKYEIWPARVELDGGRGDPRDGDIFARADWQARLPQLAKIGQGQQQTIVRTPADLLKACNNNRDEAKSIIQALRIDDIDFRTQMLVIVTGGVQDSPLYSVEILGAAVKDQVLTVTWKLNKPDPKGFKQLKMSHPAQLVVVPRFEGQVKFVEK